ncbi:MAG: hypothetical protein IIZ94_12615, partial [Prevotella sp.]|nr:hypothetical protein [Prevotella sp.]
MFDAEFYIWDYTSESYVDYSKHIVFPIKTASLLDERLNEFEVQLERLSDEVIKTNTPCRLVLKTKPKRISASSWQEARDFVCPVGDSGSYHIELVSAGVYEGYQYEEYDCIALNDDVSQIPRGLKDTDNKLMHTHKLHCIEDTKITEWTMCDSLTFTNSLGFSVENGTLAGTAVWSKVETFPYELKRGDLRKEVKPYLVIGEEITIPLFDYLAKTYKYENGNYIPVAIPQLNNDFWFTASDWNENGYSRGIKIEVINNNVVIASGICSRDPYQYGGDFSTYDNLTFTCPNAQNFEIKYTFYNPGDDRIYGYISYFPAGIRNRNPLKKWTCKDVCERIFDVCEPYAYNDLAPRFSLDPSIATHLDSVIAPEFSMTRMTLREQLQMVGRYIQAEPRINGREWDAIDKRWRFVVTFDSYRSNQTSHISSKMEVSAQAKMQGESYATELDTNVENLASQLDWAEGAIIEPIPTADLTLRGESIAVRLDDSENSIIATEFPIYAIVSLKCTGYGKRNNDGTITWTDFANTAYGKAVDITQYVYERADYNNLSNYDSLEGMSKALALCYTQGQKNVRGLFFKQESIYQAYEDYAIINILQAVTDLELSIVDYALLRFRIEYLPLASARLKTSKSIRENGLVATTPYNQGANLIESKWFGQNL